VRIKKDTLLLLGNTGSHSLLPLIIAIPLDSNKTLFWPSGQGKDCQKTEKNNLSEKFQGSHYLPVSATYLHRCARRKRHSMAPCFCRRLHRMSRLTNMSETTSTLQLRSNISKHLFKIAAKRDFVNKPSTRHLSEELKLFKVKMLLKNTTKEACRSWWWRLRSVEQKRVRDDRSPDFQEAFLKQHEPSQKQQFRFRLFP